MQKVETCKLTEAELIDLAKKNHPSAIAELIDRYKGMVFNLAYKILGNYHDAEEASQDTFIKAFRAIQGFRFDCQFSTWVYRICYNTCLTIKRGATTGNQMLNENFQYSHHCELPEGLAEMADRKDYINQAINGLASEDAAIITLFYIDEMPTAEISKVIGISEANVRIKLHRSRKQIKENLFHLLKHEATNL